MSAKELRRAVFLDRDGTLTVEGEWITKHEHLVLVPGAAEAVRALSDAGFFVVMVTNQSAVARGLIDEGELDAIHAELARMLAAEGARLDATYHCPHHPTEGLGAWRKDCECRKPKPGMTLRAAREHDLDLERSFTVGDAARDLEAGWTAGTRGVLVRTGKGPKELDVLLARGETPDHVADDVLAAARWILAQGR